MTEQLYDAVARIARHELASRSWAAIGIVADVHSSVLVANDFAVTVELRDDRTVLPRLPVTVGALGFAAAPAVGDLVLVVFADGDLHSGVVAGRLYHRDLAPPAYADGQIVLQLPPGSASPDVDVVVDPVGPELKLRIGEADVTIRGRSVSIKIGDAELLVDGNSPSAVSVTAGDSSMVLDAGGNITIEAAAKLELKATEVSIEGSGKVKVSGGIVEVN